MALSVTKESFFWHKLHSLSGIIPVGFYMVQHLVLNSFSWAGPDKYNGVSGFFYSMPEYVLLSIETFLIWLPLLFHAVYGIFIVNRAENNYFTTKYKWSQNRMYMLQRWSGVFVFFFLCVHVSMTTIKAKINGVGVVDYQHMHDMFTSVGYAWLIFYLLGVLAASYHLSYGVWNFCIRWGITISDRAQATVQKFSLGMFIVVTLIGWLALAGFFRPNHGADTEGPISTMGQFHSRGA